MVALALLSTASAAEWWLPDTAQVPAQGQAILALPTAASSWGLSERTALVVTPFAMRVGGPRLGVVHAVPLGAWQITVEPSLGVKVQGTQGLAELALRGGRTWQSGRLDLSLSPSLRLDRQRSLGEEVHIAYQQARSHVPLTVAYSHLFSRNALTVSVQLMLWDESVPFSMGLGGVDWSHRWQHLQVSVGLHGMVGTPSEQLFLGSYLHPIVAAYPTFGLWWLA